MRDIQSFKDEIVEMFEQGKFEGAFKKGPIYFVGLYDDEILVGQQPEADTIVEFMDNARELMEGSRFGAVAFTSLSADISSLPEEEQREIEEKQKQLDNKELAAWLKTKDILIRSVTIRVESENGEGNGLLSIVGNGKDMKVGEVSDDESNAEELTAPFGGGLYD